MNFLSKFTSPEQSYAATLRQEKQHQQPQAPQIYGKRFRNPMQQYLPQHEIQTSLSVQSPSVTNNDAFKSALWLNRSSQSSGKLCQKNTK
jgi:hypothetical protein